MLQYQLLLFALSIFAQAHPSDKSSKRLMARNYSAPILSYPYPQANYDVQDGSYLTLTSNMSTILSHATNISSHSWEIGTLIESILEVYYGSITPFLWTGQDVWDSEPPWQALQVTVAALGDYNWTESPSAVRNETHGVERSLHSRWSSDAAGDSAWSPGGLSAYLKLWSTPVALKSSPLIDGAGALGDPCSIGPGAWILSNYLQRDDVRYRLNVSDRTADDYAWAVGNQLLHLNQGNQSMNGTISQREGTFDMWSDMGFMIPPFPAYLGVATNDVELLGEGLAQSALEFTALLDKSSQVFRHVSSFDPRLWATGNGWLLYGTCRVLASIRAVGQVAKFQKLVDDVEAQMSATFTALFDQLDSEHLLPNYMLQSNATFALGDSAGTALVTAAYYRFANLAPDRVSPALSEKAQEAFAGVVKLIDGDGWLNHVVDPQGTNGWVVYPNSTLRSPEGQSFLGLMWAARTAAGF